MKNINELHNEAMEFADLAYFEQQKNGKSNKFIEYSNKAFALEKEAALLLEKKYNSEPSRSILLKSAIYLALDCEKYNEAERLIYLALSGNPSIEIQKELKELIKEISTIISNSECSELDELGIPQNTTIHNIHFKEGNGVGKGVIATDILTSILNKYEKLRIEVASSLLTNKKKDEIKKIGRTEIVINKAASYSVFIRPKDEVQMLPFKEFDSDSFKISKRLKLLLHDIQDFEILKNITTNHKELSKLRSFLDEISKQEIEIDFTSYFTDKGKCHEFKANRFYALKIIDNITQFEYTNEREINFEGRFLMLSLKSKQFNFLTDSEEEIKGKYSDDLKKQMYRVSFDQNYRIKILRKERKDVGTKDIVTEDEMTNIEN